MNQLLNQGLSPPRNYTIRVENCGNLSTPVVSLLVWEQGRFPALEIHSGYVRCSRGVRVGHAALLSQLLGSPKVSQNNKFWERDTKAIAHRATQPPQQSTQKAHGPITVTCSCLCPHQLRTLATGNGHPSVSTNTLHFSSGGSPSIHQGLKLPETFWDLPQAGPEVRGQRPY